MLRRLNFYIITSGNKRTTILKLYRLTGKEVRRIRHPNLLLLYAWHTIDIGRMWAVVFMSDYCRGWHGKVRYLGAAVQRCSYRRSVFSDGAGEAAVSIAGGTRVAATGATGTAPAARPRAPAPRTRDTPAADAAAGRSGRRYVNPYCRTQKSQLTFYRNIDSIHH